MLELLTLIVSVGLADSVDPAMLVPAWYFAPGRRGARRVVGFASSVFAVNIVGGVAIALGPGRFLLGLVPHPGSRTTHTVELVVGVVLLMASVVLWRRRAEGPRASHEGLKHASPLVGATIALAELPTAVPYFVVIVAVTRSHVGTASTVALLALYQVLYLTPVWVIAVISRRASHTQSGMRGDRVHSVLVHYENRVIATILFVVGVVLLALATSAIGL
jgi:cytochrome c biogenesis protein CcdA